MPSQLTTTRCANNIHVKDRDGLRLAISCGRCLPCVIRMQTHWVLRMSLEKRQHEYSSFLTLTYEDPAPENLPYHHVQQYLKELRRSSPNSIRYYCVGEYGSRTDRPHWHLILFGLEPNSAPQVTKLWRRGFTHVGSVSTGSLQYVTKYVLKNALNDKRPHIARQSNGLGKAGFADIGARFAKEFPELDRFPMWWKINGRVGYIGRYGRDIAIGAYEDAGGRLNQIPKSRLYLDAESRMLEITQKGTPYQERYHQTMRLINGTAL